MAPTAGPAAWSTEKLRAYFAHIQSLKPDLSSAASQVAKKALILKSHQNFYRQVLSAYYRRQRKTDGSEQAWPNSLS